MKKIISIVGILIIFLLSLLILQNQVPKAALIEPEETTPTTTENPVQITDATTIDLSNQNLTSIPSSVFSKTNTETLDVSNNMLTGSIQGEIRFLSKLKVLDASNNNMTGLPAEIGQLQNLEVLDVSNNQVTGLPNELGNLKNLKVLNLSGNQYSEQDLAGIRANLSASVNIVL